MSKKECNRPDCDGVLEHKSCLTYADDWWECTKDDSHCKEPGCKGVVKCQAHGYTIPATWVCTEADQHNKVKPLTEPKGV